LGICHNLASSNSNASGATTKRPLGISTSGTVSALKGNIMLLPSPFSTSMMPPAPEAFELDEAKL